MFEWGTGEEDGTRTLASCHDSGRDIFDGSGEDVTEMEESRKDSGREMFVSRDMFEETGEEIATDGAVVETDETDETEETGKDLEDLKPGQSFPSKKEAMESCKSFFARHFHPMIQVS